MGRNKISRLLLASSALTCAALGMPGNAYAGPEDGTVTGGSATISQSGLTTAIHQSSDRAIIDWRSFDVNANETVRFYQPGSSSITLNRINDSKASLINGSIEANGRIMLLNQNGIVFGTGSRVDVAGLVATTGRIDDAAFMNGATTLNVASGANLNAKIINNGTISARDAGLVGLVAPVVENNGVITAHLGKVTLAGAERFTLDLAGDGLISIDMNDEFNGKVVNTGSITADGGTIVMTATRARDAVETSLVNTGELRANRVGIHNGRIILSAGGNRPGNTNRGKSSVAAVKQAGKIQAASGQIDIQGDSIHLTETSRIDASALNGGSGGTINIGGSYQGGSDRPTATWVTADRGALTRSNGDVDGDGGTIILWADRLMTFRGEIEAEGGEESGNGGFVEISGKNRLIFDGNVSTRSQNGKYGTLLLDPTNIEIVNTGDQNVTGSSPYEASGDDVVSQIDIVTLQNALALGNVIVQTRATGSQAGDITVSAAITWASGNTLTLDAHHDIIVNQAISGGGLTFIAGNDVALNANIGGTGTFTIQTKLASGTIGLGATTGTLLLGNTELAHIVDGWSGIVVGRIDGSGTINLETAAWNDVLTVQTDTGIINVNGEQTMGANDLTLRSNANIAVWWYLTGSGNLHIEQTSASATIGIGTGQTGDIQLASTELVLLRNGWNSITFGRTDATGAMNVGARSWNDNLVLQSGSGAININGAQTMGANNLTITTDSLNIAGNLTSTGTLSIAQAGSGTSMGIGTGAAGTLNLTSAELAFIQDGWSSLSFGRDGSNSVAVTAATWNDNVQLRAGTGGITISGAQTMGANNLTILSDGDITLGAALTGTGNLLMGQIGNVSMALGSGETGAVHLNDAELALLTDGWSSLTFGTGGAINIGAATWNDNVTFVSSTGIMTVNGAQNAGANTTTLRSDSDIALNAALNGTGTLILTSTSSGIIGVGSGQTGTIQLSAADLANIGASWSTFQIGDASTGGINLGTMTWTSNLTLVSGAGPITVNGAQSMGANALTIRTDADLVLSAALTGTGTLTVSGQSVGTTIGLGTGQTGTLTLTNAEVANITNGWTSLVFGRTDGSGAINIGALTWNDALTLQSGNGVITVAGIQTMAANALTFRTDGDIALNAGLSGSTTLTFVQASASTTMGLGNSQTGSLNLNTTEIGNITNGWTSLVFGRTDGSGTVNIGALTWNDNLTLQSGSGTLNFAGTQTMGANNLNITTDADIVLTGSLTGAGTLTITQSSATTSIGLGNSATGTINLTAAEVGRLTNGWASLVFGRTDGSGTINITANTWNDNLTLRSDTGVVTFSGTQTMGANNLTITTNADIAVTAAVNSTGTLSISGQSAATTMGLGNAQAGTINLTATEIGFLTNTWGSIVMGRTDGTGTINVGALSWLDPLTLRSGSGVISINGAQTFAANNLSITTDADLNIGGTLTGTGTLTLTSQSAATTIGLGTGQTGTLSLTDTEITNMMGTWGSIVIGLTTGTGAMNVGATSWVDPLTLRTASGVITVNGTQNMAANNLTINTDSNLALAVGANLTGTGTLTITGQAAGTTIGLGSGQAGTLSLTDTEISQIHGTWASIVFGLTTATGAMNVGATSWTDNVTMRTAGGLITIAGTQTMNGNNLTINTDSNLALSGGANLTGTGGTLTISSTTAGTTLSIGTGQTGTLNLNDSEITQIVDGWGSIIIGNAAGTGAMNVGTSSWNDNLTLRTLGGVIGINGTVTMNGSNNLTIATDGNMAIGGSGALTGTGNLVIQSNAVATTIGLGNGASGTLNLTDTELARITDGWTSLTFGQSGGTGVMNVGAMTWSDSVNLITASGAINIVGAQNMGANNLTISTNADPTFSANITGSGTFTVQTVTAATTFGIAGGAGTVNLSSNDLSQILNGWNEIVFGNTAGSGAMTIGAYTWQYNTTFRTGAGAISVTGAQVNTGNNMTYETDGNMSISANISGTGILTVRPAAAATILNIATGSTGLNLTTAELAFIQDGWSKIVFGRTGATGAVNIGARTWTDNLQFISGSGVMTVSGAQTMGANNLTLTTDSDLSLGANVTGTGILTIEGASASTGIGVGTGQTGALSLNATDLTRFGTTWGTIQIGNSASTAAINLGTNSWANNMQFLTRGNVVLNGVQTSTKTSGTSLVFASLAGSFVNNTGSATPINPGTGTARYLIYSFSAATDTYGSFTPPSSIGLKTYFSYGPSAVVETGNRIIYSTGAPKIIYLRIDDKVKVYGDTVPTLTWSYVGGLEGADTLGSAITASSLSATGALTTDNVGTTTAITGNFTTGLGYTVSVTNGTMSVAKAPVTVQAANASREYGDANPTFTINYTGLKNGEATSVIDTLATAATAATATSNVTTYAITTSGAVDNNYVFNYVNGTLTVTKATLTITAEDKTREYGDANPALTVTYSGFKNSETSAVIDTSPSISTAAIATTNVGTYAITLSGGTDNNYNLNLVNGNLVITKATVTATADNQTREYGDANPALTVSYSGFKNSETSTVLDTAATASTSANALSNVGTYTITASGAADTNYNIVYADGTLNVTKATLTVTADNKTREYGDANPALTVSYSGFKNGETFSVLDSAATASTTAINTTGVGNHAITASGASDGNYDFSYVNGTLAITKATVTVTADNKTREYGDTNPALTVSYSGFKNGETASVIDTGATAATAATVLSNVASYAITASGAVDDNYDFTYVNGSLNITKAMLTATADNKTRVYGDANPALTVSYSGFKNSETASVIDTAATGATSATTLSNVGNYAITASGASDNNYDFTYANGTLAITKAMLTATADNKTRAYGDANPALTVSYSGFKNGETASVIDTAATASTTATNTTGVGNVAITAAGASDGNYDFTYVNGTLAITKATLTATAENKTREYGDANPALTVAYTGFKNGETAGVIDTGATATTTATNTTNAGNHAITVSGATDDNYDFSYVNGTLAITKATVTVTADNQTREYGDANPALTASYSGFKNGETSAVLDTAATAATSATVLSNVGSYAITSSGAADVNYDFVYVNGSLSITKAMLTATADNKTRAYGDANPALTVTYTGFKNGETTSVINTTATASTAATNTTGVGTYAIAASGASDNNYDFTYVNGDLSITKAMLTATADNKTREYGDANPALTVTYTGFKNSETASVIDTAATATTAATNATGVGNVAITVSGATDDNYDFTYTNGALSITKATVTVTADNQSREYGDANPALTYAYSGFKNGETSAVLDTAATVSTAATNLSNAGTYTITGSGGVDDNYNFNYVNGTLTVTKANLTITADDQTRIYGDANPALTLTYAGFKNADTAAALNTVPTVGTSANTLSNVGTYAITLTGGTDNNYNLVLNNGTLTVTKAMLTATANNQTREYGAVDPALTVTYTGFKNGQNSSVIDTLATATSGATILSDVGTYAITAAGANDGNYDFTYVGGTLAVTKANLTVTANNQTREYGDANPALTISYSGFRNGDTDADLNTIPTIATSANSLSNAGTYAITLTGGTDNNYNLILTNGSLTVSKATLIVTVDNQTRIYGDANPTFTAVYTGFKNGETTGVINTMATLSSAAAVTTNVGSYAITASGASDNNYNFSYVNGSMSITPASLTVTADNKTRQYGLANPTFTATYTGFKNGETASALNVGPSFSTGTNANSAVGSYTITVSGASDPNYSLTFVNGNMTITAAPLAIVVDYQVKLVGDPLPFLSYSVLGLRAGDTTAVLSGLSVTTAATNASPVGTYAITAAGASATNYTITYSQNVLDVVGTLPPPPPPPVDDSIPGTVDLSLSNPATQTQGYSSYDPTYNAYTGHVFMTDQAASGNGSVPSDAAPDETGFIRIYYYNNPFEDESGIPLMYIDPKLYTWEEEEESEDLALN